MAESDDSGRRTAGVALGGRGLRRPLLVALGAIAVGAIAVAGFQATAVISAAGIPWTLAVSRIAARKPRLF